MFQRARKVAWQWYNLWMDHSNRQIVLTREDLLAPDTVYQIGVAPNRIDLLTSITGVDFDKAWQHRKQSTIDGLSVAVLGREQLLTHKRAVGRPKDLAEIAWLEELG